MAKKKEISKPSIKFGVIKTLVENGVEALSSTSLSIEHAYKVVQFKTKIKHAYSEFESRRQQAIKEAGIDDGNKFSARFNALVQNNQRTEEEDEEFKGLVEKNNRFNELFNQLLEDDYEIEPKVMPFDQWHLLQEANKDLKLGKFELLAYFETTLEGILWKAPEE